MNRKFIITTSALLVMGLILPVAIHAAAPNLPDIPLKNLKFADVIEILNRLVTWIFTVFLIIAVIFVILAAFAYLTSAGDPEKVKKASHQILFAAIAIGIALLSVSLRFIVEELVTGQGGGPVCTSFSPLDPNCSGNGQTGP